MKNLKKLNLIGPFLILASVLFVITPVFAQPNFQTAKVQNPVTNSQVRTVVLPQTPIDASPALVYLGQALDQGQPVEGYAFIHYAKNLARPPRGKTQCYDFLAKGARWKTTESYLVDPTNSDGLSADFVKMITATSLETWDSQVAFEIFGAEASGIVDGADTAAPDNKNEVLFGNIEQPGAIAVSIVWGIFGGPVQNRKIVEYDIVFDDPDFTWGDASVNLSVMDYQNIATHEIGHGAGMNDLYQSECSEETMYGYAATGETKKRDLNAGDVSGIKKLYQ